MPSDPDDLTPVETPEAHLRQRIVEQLTHLGVSELAVLEQIVQRLWIGRQRYGELRLDSDTRDPRREAAEEALDCCIYITMMLLKPTRSP